MTSRHLNPPPHGTSGRHWPAYNLSIMFRWVIALFCAYFISGLGVSAYGTTPQTALPSRIAHEISIALADPTHEAHKCASGVQASDTGSPQTGTSSQPPSTIQLALDDLAVDLPDLLDPPSAFAAGDSLRLRLFMERPVPPHSPSLKRRPKPPKADSTLA